MTVGELSIEEFKAIIREVVDEALADYADPDFGFQLRPEFIERMKESMASEGPWIPLEEVERMLGLAPSERSMRFGSRLRPSRT